MDNLEFNLDRQSENAFNSGSGQHKKNHTIQGGDCTVDYSVVATIRSHLIQSNQQLTALFS